MLILSDQAARSFLIRYQLAVGTISDVFARLKSIQYDPLNPVGRNVDLVLQARVPDYRVDGWQTAAYDRRTAYDAWDKQACLVPMSDWPMRALIRERYHPWHDRQILDEHPEAVQAALAELDRRGPLSSLEFEDRRRAPERHSWYGPTIIKRILRALWARGELVTHHRVAGRHYYDRPERVIPLQYLQQPALLDEDAYHRWIVLRRHETMGLLRPAGSAEIWSVCGYSATRLRAIAELVDAGLLVPIAVGERAQRYHLPSTALPYLDGPSMERRVVFLGPLDSLLWDRKAVKEMFGFDYIWEVYKRELDRKWGYYVLPVLYGDRFVARVDSRLDRGTWRVSRWWWEDGVVPDADLLSALQAAAQRFLRYLGADSIDLADGVDSATRTALMAAEAA